MRNQLYMGVRAMPPRNCEIARAMANQHRSRNNPKGCPIEKNHEKIEDCLYGNGIVMQR